MNANVGLRDPELSSNIFFFFFVPYKSPPHSHYSEGRMRNKRCHVGCHNSFISDTYVFQQRKRLLDNRFLLGFGECVLRLVDEPSCFLINIGSRKWRGFRASGPRWRCECLGFNTAEVFSFSERVNRNNIGPHL